MTFFDPKREGERERWQAQAISQDDPFIIHFRHLARELNMAIALTYLEKWSGGAAEFRVADRPSWRDCADL